MPTPREFYHGPLNQRKFGEFAGADDAPHAPRQLLLRFDGEAGSGRTPAQGSVGPFFS